MLFNSLFASIAALGKPDESSDVLELLFRQPAKVELAGARRVDPIRFKVHKPPGQVISHRLPALPVHWLRQSMPVRRQ